MEAFEHKSRNSCAGAMFAIFTEIVLPLSSQTVSLVSVIFCCTTGSDFERIQGRTGNMDCMFRCLDAVVAGEESVPSTASRWCGYGEPCMVVVYLLEKAIITSQSRSCCIVCGVFSCVAFVSRPCRHDV
jgi:hypothetical protein